MMKAFRQIFAQQKHRIRSYRTDKGTEFASKQMAHFFEKEGVHHYMTQNPPKANFAERVIKTLKSKIMRYFTQHQTHRYIDVLDDIVSAYNRRKHSSIGLPPIKVTQKNSKALWEQLYAPPRLYKHLFDRTRHAAPIPFRFKVGDYVKILYIKHKFTCYYDQSWTDEVF